MSLIFLNKPDGKIQLFWENYKYSKTSNKTTTLGSKDYLCTDPYVFFIKEHLLIKKFNK